MYHSNDIFGPFIFLFSFFMITLSGLFHAFQLLGATVGILSGLLVGSWFLALHVDKVNAMHGGSWRAYLKSFIPKKPKLDA